MIRPLRNHRQNDPRRTRCVVEGLLTRGLQGRLAVVIAPGVMVSVEVREVAAGDVQTDAVPPPEQVGRRIYLYRVFVSPAGLDERRAFEGLSVACPNDAVAQFLREAVGVHVDQLGREIRVLGGGGGEQLYDHRPRHLYGFFERRRRIDQYIPPPVQRALIDGRVLSGTDCPTLRYDPDLAGRYLERDQEIYTSLGIDTGLQQKIFAENLRQFLGAL